jgi:hypothetical protein
MKTTINFNGRRDGNIRKENEIEFQNFVATCKNAAIEADCDLIINYMDMERYNRPDWWQAAFVVDNFGGIVRLVASVNEKGAKKGNGSLADAIRGLTKDVERLREIRSNMELANID